MRHEFEPERRHEAIGYCRHDHCGLPPSADVHDVQPSSEKRALEAARKELKEVEDSIYAKIRAIDRRIDEIEVQEMRHEQLSRL